MTTFPAEVSPELDWTNPLTRGSKHFWGLSEEPTTITDGNATGQSIDFLHDKINGIHGHGYLNDGSDRPPTATFDEGLGLSLSGAGSGYCGAYVLSGALKVDCDTSDFTFIFIGRLNDVTTKAVLMGAMNTSLTPWHLYGQGLYVEAGEIYAWRSKNNASQFVKLPVSTGFVAIAVSVSGASITLSVNGTSISGVCGSVGQNYNYGFGQSTTSVGVNVERYRMDGVIYSQIISSEALSELELNSLTADPYQIFRTAEDAVNDYNLVLDTNSHVDIPALATTNNSSNINWDLETSIAPTSTENFIVLGVATGTAYVLYINLTTGDIYYSSNSGGAVLIGTGFPLDDGLHTLKVSLRWSGGDKVFTCSIDGVAQAPYTHANAGIWGFTQIGASLSDGRVGAVAYLKFTDLENSANNRYYDFNRTQGTVVPELLNGQNGTLVGFPTESGYVYENGEIVGYRFNGNGSSNTSATGTIATFPDFEIFNVLEFTVEFENFIRYADTNMRVLGGDSSTWFYANATQWGVQHGSGNGADHNYTIAVPPIGEAYNLKFSRNSSGLIEIFINDVVAGSFQQGGLNAGRHLNKIGELTYLSNTHRSRPFSFSKLHITTPSKSLSFDATTGDVDSFPELINGDHAVLTETKTSGWMPIIEKQVFTVGATGKDYTNISAVLSNNPSVYRKKIIVHGSVDIGASMDNAGVSGDTSHPNGIEIVAADGEWFTGDINASIASITGLFQLRSTDVTAKGLCLQAVEQGLSEAKYWTIENCLIDAAGYNIGLRFIGGGDSILKDSLIMNAVKSGVEAYAAADKANNAVINSLVVNCNTSNNFYGGGVIGPNLVQNCIFYGNNYSALKTINNIDKCVTDDATGDIPNIDFTGAFADG